MQHLVNDVKMFCEILSLINYNSSVAKINYSILIKMCFYFFRQLFTQLCRFSTEIFSDKYVCSS